MVLEKAKNSSWDCHRKTARESTLYTNPDAVVLQRFDLAPSLGNMMMDAGNAVARYGDDFSRDCYWCMFFMRQDLREPPDDRGHNQANPEQRNDPMCNQAGDGQRDPQRQDHRPDRRRRQIDETLDLSVTTCVVMLHLYPSSYLCCSSTQHVNHGEDNYPNRIDEMPVQRKHF